MVFSLCLEVSAEQQLTFSQKSVPSIQHRSCIDSSNNMPSHTQHSLAHGLSVNDTQTSV